VRNEPPGRDDFKAWRVENQTATVTDECKACGVSILQEMEDVRRLQRRVASQRSKRVAVGTLKPEFGVLKHTPGKYAKSHHSWWVPTACDPSEVFEVVEQPELEGEQ
jgi:hypothetical protein